MEAAAQHTLRRQSSATAARKSWWARARASCAAMTGGRGSQRTTRGRDEAKAWVPPLSTPPLPNAAAASTLNDYLPLPRALRSRGHRRQPAGRRAILLHESRQPRRRSRHPASSVRPTVRRSTQHAWFAASAAARVPARARSQPHGRRTCRDAQCGDSSAVFTRKGKQIADEAAPPRQRLSRYEGPP